MRLLPVPRGERGLGETVKRPWRLRHLGGQRAPEPQDVGICALPRLDLQPKHSSTLAHLAVLQDLIQGIKRGFQVMGLQVGLTQDEGNVRAIRQGILALPGRGCAREMGMMHLEFSLQDKEEPTLP
jgi:hypothetical protein